MNLDIKKIFGYFLLCSGLICIVFALYSAYNVFTNSAKPPEIFQLNSLVLSVNSGEGKAPIEITVPLDAEVKKVVNMFLYYMFMLFILSVGSKIGALGIQFIREIKVEMRKEE